MYAALLLSLFAVFATDARPQPTAWTHVHPMSPVARDLLDAAVRRSSLVRDLLDELERSDVIVLLMMSTELTNEARRPYMRFLSAPADTRYVVVQLYAINEPPVMQVPSLAHELRHAVEFAAARDVRDQAAYARLFASIGWSTGPRRFETDAARETERQVRQEIGGAPVARAASRPAATAGNRTPGGVLP